MNDKLTLSGFLLRALLALALVMLTFNPSGQSYIHMLAKDFPQVTPLETVLGIALLIAWVVLLGATLRAIGVLGFILALAFFAATIWMIVSWGWVSFSDHNAIIWIGLIVLSLILAIGTSWSYLYRRLTGQAIVDDVDDGQ